MSEIDAVAIIDQREDAAADPDPGLARMAGLLPGGEVGRIRRSRVAWADRVKAAPAEIRSELERRNDGKLPADWQKAIAASRTEFDHADAERVNARS